MSLLHHSGFKSTTLNMRKRQKKSKLISTNEIIIIFLYLEFSIMGKYTFLKMIERRGYGQPFLKEKFSEKLFSEFNFIFSFLLFSSLDFHLIFPMRIRQSQNRKARI